jgi:hypothetical protein
MWSRLFGLSICLAVGCAVGAGTRSSTCHIHPPGSTPDNPVNIIGPFASVAECETERKRRFSGEGRCHCQADFTPRWYPPDPTLNGRRQPTDLL